MANGRWDPFEEMESALDEGFKPVPLTPRLRQPRLNMYEDKDELVLELEAPGFRPEEFDISIEGGRLHVTASHQEESQKSDPERSYFCHEISQQSFERWIQLPYAVKEGAEAHYEDGLLHIRVRELAPHKAKRISVNHGPRQSPK